MKYLIAGLVALALQGCTQTSISEADARSKTEEIERAAQKMGEQTKEDRR